LHSTKKEGIEGANGLWKEEGFWPNFGPMHFLAKGQPVIRRSLTIARGVFRPTGGGQWRETEGGGRKEGGGKRKEAAGRKSRIMEGDLYMGGKTMGRLYGGTERPTFIDKKNMKRDKGQFV
jgi:hypothetical protein